MTDHVMQIISGRVTGVSQKSNVIDVYSQNVGWTTEQNEEIALRLDSEALPLILKTDSTRDIFVAKDDRVEIACIKQADRLAIFGIRNATDDSVYLVRTSKVSGARIDLMVLVAVVLVSAICCGIVGVVARSLDHMLDIYLDFVGVGVGLYVLSTVLRSVFGFVIWPGIRKLAQPGGRREMIAAKKALALSSTEDRNIRYL